MIRNIFIMFILDESEIYYMSDIRKLLEQDRLEFEADQKIKNLDNIVQALRNGRLSIFAGAGLSASSGYVNWKQLIKPMSDYLGLNINTDLTMIAQYYENECTREGLNRAILNEFSKVPTKNDNMEILASLPIDTYWTTNYDSIIEDTLLRNGKTVDVIYEQIQYKNILQEEMLLYIRCMVIKIFRIEQLYLKLIMNYMMYIDQCFQKVWSWN